MTGRKVLRGGVEGRRELESWPLLKWVKEVRGSLMVSGGVCNRVQMLRVTWVRREWFWCFPARALVT